MIFSCGCLSAQTIHMVRDSLKIHFRQVKIDLVQDFRNNRRSLERTADSLRTSYAAPVYRLQKIHIVGGASPEGSVKRNNRNVNFYAAVNALSSGKEGADPNYVFHRNNTGTFSVPTIDVNVPEDVTAQKDLIYAVKTARNKNNTDGTVNLNFRHALSQVVFTAINPSRKLYAEIKGISICNVKKSGTFTYPANNNALF